MESKPKRPLSIWIAQFLLALYVVLFPIPFGYWVYVQFEGSPGPDWGDGNPYSSLMLPLTVSVAIGSLGIATRKNWGRWVVVASLCLVMVVFVAMPFLGTQAAWRPFTAPDEVLEDFITLGIVWSPLILVILLLSVGRSVNAFFNSPHMDTGDSRISEPPPPPTFES